MLSWKGIRLKKQKEKNYGILYLYLKFEHLLCYVESHFSHVQFFATLWIIARQTPLSIGFSRQEYLPFPSPGKLPNPGIKLVSLKSPALTARFFTNSDTWEDLSYVWEPLFLIICIETKATAPALCFSFHIIRCVFDLLKHLILSIFTFCFKISFKISNSESY